MPNIIIYSTAACPYCDQAKALFKLKKAAFKEIRVDTDPKAREEMMSRTHRKTVPQIFINDQHIGGFSDLQALDQAGKLDPLLV